MSTNNAIAVTLRARAQAAFERLSSACPEDAEIVGKYLAALHGKNVIALDEGEAFVLTDSGGRQIKATKRTVRLSVENAGLVQPVFNGPYVISAPGYGMLARAAGAVVMNAPTVTVDGVIQQNPYVRRGPDGTVLEVHCRSTAFRYNENGQPVVSDRTTVFDTGTYTLSDMVGKAKKHKEAFRLLPAAFPAPEPPEQWACYRVDEAINLWMKITHDEVLTFLGQVLNRKKKALEFAQTFAQRNALKHLFGLSVAPKNVGTVWDVPVLCWVPVDGGLIRFDMSKYEVSTKIIEALTAGQPVALPEAKDPIVISRGTDEVAGSELNEETDPLENPDCYADAPTMDAPRSAPAPVAAPSPEPEPEPEAAPEPEEAPAVGWTQKELKAWNNLAVVKQEFPSEYRSALLELGLREENVTPENAEEINRTVSRIMDADNQEEA